MNMRNSELSALFDGELEAHEVRAAVRAALGSDERRADWQLYALISDGLRGESADVPDLTANVMERIREEPVVLAPRKLVNVRPQHPLFALAASIAGVAVVGWLALAGGAAQKPEAVARLAAASPAPSFVAMRRSENPLRLSERSVGASRASSFCIASHSSVLTMFSICTRNHRSILVRLKTSCSE